MEKKERKVVYPLLNLHCAGCAQKVEKLSEQEKGVISANVNFADSSISIRFDDKEFDLQSLSRKISEAGYELITQVEDPFEKQEELIKKNYKALGKRVLGAWLLALPLGVLGMSHHWHFEGKNIIMMLLSFSIMIFFGRYFFVRAWKIAKKRSADMDTLVALSVLVSFLFSLFNTIFPEFWSSRGMDAHLYYEASGMIIAFVLLGKWLEERSKQGTSQALKGLMGLQPKEAYKVVNKEGELSQSNPENYQIEKVKINLLKPDNIVLIRPGEKIPTDGIVVQGSSYIDESMITGESLPVERNTGGKVIAGTINKQGTLQVRVSESGENTVLSQMIRRVREAQGSKAPVQRIADKIASVFVPIVILLSIATLLIWLSVGGSSYFAQALNAAVSVLVIACPCALGLATPTALMVGIGRAANKHILVKDAAALEQMKSIDIVVMDKTGTLTEGKPSVVESIISPLYSDNSEKIRNILSILKAGEMRSNHPVAEAVLEWIDNEETNLKMPEISTFEQIAGRGVEFKIKTENSTDKYWIGSLAWAEDILDKSYIMPEAMNKKLSLWLEKGYSLALLGKASESGQNELLMICAVSDKINDQAYNAIKQLQGLGIEVCMLTGDNKNTAAIVANSLGIDRFEAQMLPNDKENYITQLKAEGKRVAMVGDGINDSQALAVADVSIAMGKGTDVAMQVAMVTILQNKLELLPQMIQWSYKTMKCVKENLFWAFIYNIVMIPIAAGILFPISGFMLNPMLASAAMALSSVSVVGNSLRLKAKKW